MGEAMHIEGPRRDIVHRGKLVDQLRRLVAQPTAEEMRPCPGCHLRCSRCGASTCTCQCAPSCTNAPRALSTEPERHPIEDAVTPLVYELAALRLLQPCWSCEGHLGHDGTLWRPPQVSFYAASGIYVHLLARHLNQSHIVGRLIHPWHIQISDFGHDLGPVYTIRPEAGAETPLTELHSDLRSLAEGLAAAIRSAARCQLAQLEG